MEESSSYYSSWRSTFFSKPHISRLPTVNSTTTSSFPGQKYVYYQNPKTLTFDNTNIFGIPSFEHTFNQHPTIYEIPPTPSPTEDVFFSCSPRKRASKK
jgi:hypothetical protein